MIRRNTLNFLVDLITLLVMLGVVTTGLLLRWVLPPSSRGGAGRTLWSWGRHDFGDLHFYLVLGMLAILLVHLALHWNWVCITVRKWFMRDPAGVSHPVGWIRQAWGVLALALIVSFVTGFIALAMHQVTFSAGSNDHAARAGAVASDVLGSAGRRHGTAQRAMGEVLRGSMTLAEAAAASAMDVDEVRARLNLPASVSESDRLGSAARDQGLTMADVRERLTRAAE